jgi:hypothetical protein
MPARAKILTAQVNQEQIYLWALVDTENPREQRFIEVYDTGFILRPASRVYIGTVQLDGGSTVRHVFERLPEIKPDELRAQDYHEGLQLAGM